jgi:hypothetical protein
MRWRCRDDLQHASENLQPIFRECSGNVQAMFKQPSRRHPIFPDVNNTRPDRPIAASGSTSYRTRVPEQHPMARRARPRRVRQLSGITGGHDTASELARSMGTPVGKGGPGAEPPSRRSLTLADVIAAVQDVVGPKHVELVVATVRLFLGTGWLMGVEPEPLWAHHSSRRKSLPRCKGRNQPAEPGAMPVVRQLESRV